MTDNEQEPAFIAGLLALEAKSAKVSIMNIDLVSLGGVVMTTFICGSCDDTHLAIDFGPGLLSLAMTPKQAEALAAALNNPRPLPPLRKE